MKIIVYISLILSFYTGFSQVPEYCSQIWSSIERYQTGRVSNLLSTEHDCKTDSLCKKLISLLNNEFTEQELQEYIKNRNGKDWMFYIENRARQMVGKDSSRFETVKDSLAKDKIEHWRNWALTRHVDNSVIRLIGKLDIKEAIPDLHKALNDPSRYDTNQVQLSLARLEDSIYYPLFLERYSKPIIIEGKTASQIQKELYVRNTLLFICTQESLYRYAQYLKIDTGFKVGFEYYHIGYKILQNLYTVIENEDFQQYYKERYEKEYGEIPILPVCISKEYLDKEGIQYGIEWMEKNKGNYIIRRE